MASESESESEKRETLADIVAEMRRGTKLPGYWRSCDLNKILKYHADRIEATWKRDAAIHAMTCEANERLREHLEIALEDNKRPVGNAAAMREALEKLVYNIELWASVFGIFSIIDRKTFLDAKAALSAPARNCDLFGGDPKMLNTVWFDWTASPSGHDANGVAKMTFAGWLLSKQSTKKEGCAS